MPHLALLFAPQDLFLILIVSLLFFGPKRLPEFGEVIGDGIRKLRAATSGEDTTPKLP
jgi:TatA/E family protein of Tat protein translocase